MTIKTAVKATALLAVYGTAVALALLVYRSYLYGYVRTIAVSDLSDLDEAFVVGSASLRVRNREFTKVCFAGDFAYALEDARQWFDPEDPNSRWHFGRRAVRLMHITTIITRRSFCCHMFPLSSCNWTCVKGYRSRILDARTWTPAKSK